MDIIQNILEKMFEICEKKNINPDIFHRGKSLSKYKTEIQKRYTSIINMVLTGIPIYKTSIEGKDDKTIKNIKLCFEGVFEKFLEEIKRKYPRRIWEVKKKKAKKIENLSKRKMCLG